MRAHLRCCWWKGDRVGGEGVYAHAASHGPMPPRIGWRIPHDGVVVPSFTLSVKGARGDADMSVEARMNDAKDLVVKAEATVDSAIGLADQILKGTAEVLEESVEAVRERLEAERTALLEAKASVESHSEACIMSTEMPEATEAELSVLQARLLLEKREGSCQNTLAAWSFRDIPQPLHSVRVV